MTKLSFQQLKSFALGVDELELCAEYVRVHRVPRSLRPVYGDTESRAVRMACTAGARLRFRSNTRCVHLALRFGRWARTRFRCDLVLDHSTFIPVGPEDFCERWEGSITLPNSAATQTIDLWLPHTAECHVEYVAVDDSASIAPAPHPRLRWLAYGDSITQGMDATLPTRTWVGRCALALDAEVNNLGIGGAMLEPALAVDSGIDADLVTIAFGTNDFGKSVPLDEFVERGRKLLAMLRASRSSPPIVLVTPPPWIGGERPGSGCCLDDYRDAMNSLADPGDRITIARGPDLIPADMQYLPDSVHPNDAGFGLMAQRLLPILWESLRVPA